MATSDGLKVVIVGAGAVGKSSLVIRYAIGDFFDHYDPTIEDYYRKLVEVDGIPVYLDMLDTAGQQEFASMQQEFYRQGAAFLIVYSITNPHSFTHAKSFKDKIIRARDHDSPPIAIMLIGNKCDLQDERQVQQSDGQKLADKWNCPFQEVSAKELINVTHIFEELVREYRRMNGVDTANSLRHHNMKSICNCNCNYISSLCQTKSKEEKDQKIQMEEIVNKSETTKYDDRTEIRFYKVKQQPTLDIIDPPVLALKNFKINRQFSLSRFVKSILCGILLPITIILQTLAFLMYSVNKNPCYYPEHYPYDKIHHSLLLDFLGMIIGRYPNYDPDAPKDRRWFLTQTKLQQLQRVIITILLCLTFLICCYNISQTWNNQLRVSLMETIGPFLLFWIVWLLLSVWIGYESTLNPPMPSTFRL
eukprot:348587_1